jgi:tetratricopeptide (TPR) repeat protein
VLSCKTSTKSMSSDNNQLKGSDLTVPEQQAVEEYYYNGIKAKLIDNDVSKAAENFEKCLLIDKQNTGALYELARINMQMRKYPDAQKMLETATRIDPQNKWYILALVETYSQQSDFSSAILTLRKMAELEPYNFETYLKLSDLYVMDHQPLKAIKVLDEVEQLSGIIPDITDRKRRIYLSIDKFEEAVNELQKLCDAYPYNTDYIKALIDMYSVYDKTDNIIPLYQKILSIDSLDGRAQMVMAEYYRNTRQNELAMQYTEKLIRNPQLDAMNKINYLMLTYAKEKITPETRNILMKYTDQLMEVHPANSQVIAFKADIYYNTGQSDSALQFYIMSLDLDKSNYMIWKKVILIYFEKKNYTQAAQFCLQATDYFPTNPEIYFYQAIALMQLKKNSDAAAIFETGVTYVINNKPLLQQYYANMGEVYHALNNNENSDKYYEKALELDPNDALVLNNFAYFLSVRRVRLDDAKKMSERSLQIDPDNPANLDTYGWILYLMNDFEGAEKQISKALVKVPDDPDILEHYGDILFKLGKVDNAVEQWQKAKINGANSPNLDRKISDRKLYE